MISIRSRYDVMDIWKDMNKGTKVILWCNGLRSKSKKRVVSIMILEGKDREKH